jgi:membrane-bound ClpP family serine protease
MAERLPQSHESMKQSHGELEKVAAERLKNLEHQGEKSPDKRSEIKSARERIKHTEVQAPQHEAAPKNEPVDERPLLTKELSYKHTMISLQHRLKPAARRFSKVIHSPAVEATSEVIGKTILRPSVSLGATSCALLVAGSLYLFARYYGFTLRGSEIWIALIVGGFIGLLIEALYKTVRRARRRF